ncbi:hypothetical protein KL918_001223 [Ogataea parapolymorpha]|uniref:ENTH domain-containing protein n=1 Tax=Ogataea parapolymorpha (strain ATCC 26012 / BCRC 20466 / JCM 22074 / NRRL Y-7560 / DL-1) TaxID=871575 RepID=W1QEE2_OGAPD|nr:hypothetical protein HPODL_05219 [Ogataea parapolymorpha DL-1]ESW99838.1 hypothetical protein HPODL_05219 [Ogataea parapolymorpha DL-1]KAG7868580.1 hypothetical protein KL918_001223 [Ogataea parapolymorpha]KAG7874637.1 hypothetical protein KL916_001403 [Ogataea parapolymorpha]
MSTTKSVIRTLKNVANGYSNVQVMVRNATSNDPTGPTTAQMADVANHTYENGEFLEVMDIIDRRLNDKGKNWRHIAKSLTLLDYLVRYGSEDVVLWAKENMYIIKTLREFQVNDMLGADQGAIIRVKAKELTALLRDDERLNQERELARQRMTDRRTRRKNRMSPDEDEYDEALQKALEESRLTAEEEARRRRNQSDESLEKAIQLSLEEEEMRKRNNNLLDLDDNSTQPPQVFGYYPQGQEMGQIIGYDMYGNPVYANQQMNTGYLQNAYQDMAMQQQMYQQQLYEQQLAQQQAQQMAAYQQQLAQQQLLLQQQQQQQQQQQIPLKTGSNNPFAHLQQQQQQQQQQQAAPQSAKPVEQAQQQEPLRQTPTGIQKMNEQYSKLNALLATGTGVDTFGNIGDTRIPAQHTKTGTFINSYGTGIKQEIGSNSANPFFDTQYTGIPSTGITPSYTGYGFGNQQAQKSGSNANGASLIDL